MRQFLAHLLALCNELQDFVNVVGQSVMWVDLEPSSLQRLQRFGMFFHVVLAVNQQEVGIEIQTPLRHDVRL